MTSESHYQNLKIKAKKLRIYSWGFLANLECDQKDLFVNFMKRFPWIATVSYKYINNY